MLFDDEKNENYGNANGSYGCLDEDDEAVRVLPAGFGLGHDGGLKSENAVDGVLITDQVDEEGGSTTSTTNDFQLHCTLDNLKKARFKAVQDARWMVVKLRDRYFAYAVVVEVEVEGTKYHDFLHVCI